MRRSRKSTWMAAAEGPGRHFLLHLGPGVRQAIDADGIYFVEATGDDTRVRTRDVRPIGELEPLLLRRGFLRTHRKHPRQPPSRALGAPQSARGRREFDPPVNLGLPVSRD